MPDPHDALPWNAMVDLCAMEELEACTPVQRRAALVFWYQEEVNNGGHFQYFVNKASFPHREVVATLRELGAAHSASVLEAVLRQLDGHSPLFPDTAEGFETERQEFDLCAFDAQWGTEGDKEIQAALRRYLKAHESEFVEWVP
jgi:hypothetical protein